MAALLPEYAEHVARIIEARRALLPRWYLDRLERVLEERALREQIRRDVQLIGGIIGEATSRLPADHPRRDEGDLLRSEVAALCTYIAEVIL